MNTFRQPMIKAFDLSLSDYAAPDWIILYISFILPLLHLTQKWEAPLFYLPLMWLHHVIPICWFYDIPVLISVIKMRLYLGEETREVIADLLTSSLLKWGTSFMNQVFLSKLINIHEETHEECEDAGTSDWGHASEWLHAINETYI